MADYKLATDNTLKTPVGTLNGVTEFTCYGSGELMEIYLNERNTISNYAGTFTPAYTKNKRRKYKPSLVFYKSGEIKAIYLETAERIMTPVGIFPAEYVTFYETGHLESISPTDGKISDNWTLEDEKDVNLPFHFDLGFTRFTAFLDEVSFHPSGNLKSIKLYPGEMIKVSTDIGGIKTKIGFSLCDTYSTLSTVEPAEPIQIDTPIGKLAAFNPNAATRNNGHKNSLRFNCGGKVISLITVGNRIGVKEKEKITWYEPREIDYQGEKIKVGVKVTFDKDFTLVTLNAGVDHTYPIQGTEFIIEKADASGDICAPENCNNCGLCRISL